MFPENDKIEIGKEISARHGGPQEVPLEDIFGNPYNSTRRTSTLDEAKDTLNQIFGFPEIGAFTNKFKKHARRVRGNGGKTDPFQFFEVEHEPCNMLRVRITRGREITKGRFGDLMDVPDPYVIVHVPEAPDGRKQTQTIDNDCNPEWNEELLFYLKPQTEEKRKIIAHITLMDSNYALDETIGAVEFDLSKVPMDETLKKTFNFFETSEVDIEFTMQSVYNSDIRCSLALCDEEKRFRTMRKKVVLEAMRRSIPANGPRTLRETPTVAILGSGGGFRAMTGYAGAMKALYDSGILNCATYIGGLSGSSWYLSTLYSHDDFPRLGPSVVSQEIRSSIETSWLWFLGPEGLMRYSSRLRQKRKQGQPVTFTDFFGMLIGQMLLGKEKMENRKLSDMQLKLKDASLPMPIFTCLHVRSNMSAMTFHDWVEFTPYEIGIAKYGTFLKTEYFGSKFFMGVLVKKYDESPLHFLQGVWGSAFSILFNRLIEKSNKDGNNDSNSKHEDEREALSKEMAGIQASGGKNPDEEDSEEEDADEEDEDEDFVDAHENLEHIKAAQEQGRRHTWFTGITRSPAIRERPSIDKKRGSMFSLGNLFSWGSPAKKLSPKQQRSASTAPQPKQSMLNSFVSNMFNSYAIMQTREFRAGKILNYMRGLSLSNTYPISPFAGADHIAEVDEFKHVTEAMECFRKKVHLVDSGLTFNTPYPPILRPQRGVDLIISFDFSARPSDNHQPFKEILLAEKWARLHGIAFPKIDVSVYDPENMKECYVFQDTGNERAPIIIHFVLCNEQFKKFSKPGVPREAGDTRADFSIFDNPKTPYSTFNFQYSHQAFDDLHDLMEFNTLLNIETIKEQIQHCVQLRRRSKSRCSITLNDIRKSRHLTKKGRNILEKVLHNKDALFLD
uniref:cytosolic phospholipase A2-like isoform X2 n=1 Tax=Styela clava TaxID=7725 RepID=UPI00193A74F7|nr:cytosolic phospholipase A2-like isoform X2 [Styela clava]